MRVSSVSSSVVRGYFVLVSCTDVVNSKCDGELMSEADSDSVSVLISAEVSDCGTFSMS